MAKYRAVVLVEVEADNIAEAATVVGTQVASLSGRVRAMELTKVEKVGA